MGIQWYTAVFPNETTIYILIITTLHIIKRIQMDLSGLKKKNVSVLRGLAYSRGSKVLKKVHTEPTDQLSFIVFERWGCTPNLLMVKCFFKNIFSYVDLS